MTKVSVTLAPEVALFYARLALATGQTLEQVLADALFKLAGELSLEALKGNCVILRDPEQSDGEPKDPSP